MSSKMWGSRTHCGDTPKMVREEAHDDAVSALEPLHRNSCHFIMCQAEPLVYKCVFLLVFDEFSRRLRSTEYVCIEATFLPIAPAAISTTLTELHRNENPKEF
ncbi:hypothetical protein ANANG_G00035060 [Anguilla anguilla]|uniref:Uncharacterized protein n=1 Tax=Anguilla anguilla TaxID=7936 RepID=A0A9D3S464_ANGAN|nr:hypothetical protein ANANG_G00035060 [Anguilla anguilla]